VNPDQQNVKELTSLAPECGQKKNPEDTQTGENAGGLSRPASHMTREASSEGAGQILDGQHWINHLICSMCEDMKSHVKLLAT